MTFPGYGPCFLCNLLGHLANACPELQPAATKADHEERIEKYKRWFFDDHQIDIKQKRKLIEMERDRWRKANAPKTGARK